MSERTIYKPGAQPVERRKEWVSLPGGDLCVWEMTVAESAQILERSQRPAIDPRGGQSQGQMVALQIMLSCYDGDGPNAQRIFGDCDVTLIYELPFQQFDVLLQAINRVNGKDATEQERLRDFTTATGAPNTSG